IEPEHRRPRRAEASAARVFHEAERGERLFIEKSHPVEVAGAQSNVIEHENLRWRQYYPRLRLRSWRILRRNCRGDTPAARRNARWKPERSPNPTANAASVTGRSSTSRRAARAIRVRTRY